ncbi:MAG: four helix bundle protein [Calditrichaeota bacterium]|nr:MAG: four helix bundle protein [Calditrichota bacterium]
MGYDDFRDMPVWQNSFKLVIRVYEETRTFPDEEKYGMVSDMWRAANYITHNIAEGFGRFESRDKTRFYKISRGSVFELMSQILVAAELGYLDKRMQSEELLKLCKSIIAELNALIISLENKGKNT